MNDFTNYVKDVNAKNFEIYGKEILDIKNRLDSDAFYLEKNQKVLMLFKHLICIIDYFTVPEILLK